MASVRLCVLAVLLATVSKAATAPLRCVVLPATQLVGGDLPTGPLCGLPSAEACCDACLAEYSGQGCVGYTFYDHGDATECHLKTDEAVAKRAVGSTSGFPNYYAVDDKPELSQAVDAAMSVAENLRLTLTRRGDLRQLSLTPADDTNLFGRLTPGLGEDCMVEGMLVNWALMAKHEDPLVIYGLDCPAQCLRECYMYTDVEGRYSCISYNFEYSSEVSECWLNQLPVGVRPAFGMISGFSGRDGTERGPPSMKALNLKNEYNRLIKKNVACIEGASGCLDPAQCDIYSKRQRAKKAASAAGKNDATINTPEELSALYNDLIEEATECIENAKGSEHKPLAKSELRNGIPETPEEMEALYNALIQKETKCIDITTRAPVA